LLDRIGIEYDPEKKYADKNGNSLGIPEKPTVLKV
jgi:hypothetical protein